MLTEKSPFAHGDLAISEIGFTASRNSTIRPGKVIDGIEIHY
jgi:hypothetical protein